MGVGNFFFAKDPAINQVLLLSCHPWWCRE